MGVSQRLDKSERCRLRFEMFAFLYSECCITFCAQTGELVNMMAGEELSSTDLHLANGDTLLVGQVAEVEQVDSADIAAANRLHYRKLQVGGAVYDCLIQIATVN